MPILVNWLYEDGTDYYKIYHGVDKDLFAWIAHGRDTSIAPLSVEELPECPDASECVHCRVARETGL